MKKKKLNKHSKNEKDKGIHPKKKRERKKISFPF